MRVRVYQETINEVGQFRRAWHFACGCQASGVSSSHQRAGWNGIGVIPCPQHTSAFADVEFRWPEDLLGFFEEVTGDPVELEYVRND